LRQKVQGDRQCGPKGTRPQEISDFRLRFEVAKGKKNRGARGMREEREKKTRTQGEKKSPAKARVKGPVGLSHESKKQQT